MIKILHVVSGLDGGGVETMLYNYYMNMDHSNIRFDFIVHDLNIGMLEEKFTELGCRIYHVTPKKISFIKNAKEIYKIIKEGDYDIVHSHQNTSSFLPLILAKIIKVNVRIAHSHVGYTKESIVQRTSRYPFKLLTKLFSTDWFACSSIAGKWLFGNKRTIKDFFIIKNAIDLEKFKYNEDIRKAVRSELRWEDKFVIGNVARFYPEKNHTLLINIFKEIHTVCPNAVLALIGGEGQEEKIRNMVSSLGLTDNVKFLGVRNDVHRLMQAMDVFILPSKFEGFGMVFIEAQAASLKTYASNAVPNETKITDLIEYISLEKSAEFWAEKVLSTYGKNNRKQYNQSIYDSGFDIKSEASKLTKIYYRLLKYSV